MHLKLNNEIFKYKLPTLKKRHFYPIETDKHLFSQIIKFTILHWHLLHCSTTNINPKINQESDDFTSTAFKYCLYIGRFYTRGRIIRLDELGQTYA